MRLLLDTHIFLWLLSGDPRLPLTMQEAIRDPENDVFLSPISLWEAIIKHQTGKLPLPQPPERYLTVGRAMHAIMSLPVDEESVSRVAHLPMIHRDPFDRLLIAQAIQHNLVLATVDTMVRAYPMVMIF